ncbi:unnamed protein product [Clonostachys chloroleuca]|uniref:Uncharacterized protein n=1 Tax=Clonostachys chloroleuca TaxID=1926264 RepID=A0AA35MHL4_9HYPO|nr:unnamed protein product [Clonostachys chloroleuca]
MLTAKQPSTYGYKSVHDLPTPPSTSRPSPPLAHQDQINRHLPALRRSSSPVNHPMPTSHRGLPPPAAMALPPQQSTSSSLPHPTQLSVNPPQQTGTPHLSGQSWTTLPTPTSTWQEESLRNWLQARSEEEKTRQEEEKTRQETLRLEQRKIEAEMLRQSIGGGIPPAMIPIVFAGMGGGGTLPQTALEWAQQFMSSAQGGHHPQLLPAQVPVSPRHQRDQQPPPPGQYASGTPTAASYGPYPASPSRARAQGTGPPVGHPMATTSSLPASGGVAPPSAQLQPQPGQEASPGISFHHWQPPQSYGGGGTTRPGSPSGDPPRKRKATGPQPVGSSFSNEQRLRSPPPFPQATSANPPPSRKHHKRQKSDMSWYSSSLPMQERAEEADRSRGDSLGPASGPASRPTSSRGRSRSEAGKPSVSSLLSTEPVERRSPGAHQ